MPGTASCGGLWGLKFGHTDILGRPADGSPLARPGQRGGRIGLSAGISAPHYERDDLPLRSARGVASFKIAGVSRDAQGNILPLCTVMLFRSGSDLLVSKVVSEAGTGYFSFLVPDTTTEHYAVFYKAGAPDVAGTTVNTLKGS